MNLGRTLLNEAVNSDECNKGSADITIIEQELNTVFESMLEYDPEIIELHEKDVYVVEQNGNIFIEWADLSKFMESNFIDVSTAVYRLINFYDGSYSESTNDYITLSKDNFYVVVDIEEEVEDLLNEAKRGSNVSKQKLIKTNTIVDHLVRNGIKLAKRKGKGKKSRKKNKK